jgi:hypothetical protein
MVNFILVGSQAALVAANWNVADIDDKEAALKAAPETYQKKDYLAMPMSGLYLFDRRQDFGFERDRRNGKVTHKIDPAVDGERENIGQTLQESGKLSSLTYYLPPDPVQDAKNATGGEYHSDGRILVMFLQK